MSVPRVDPLADLADRVAHLPAPVLMLVDDADPESGRWRRVAVDGRVLPLSELTEDIAGRARSLLLVVRDRAALRRSVSGLARVGRVRVVACWLADAAGPLPYVPAADLPPLESLASERTPGGAAVLVARFSARVPGVATLVDMARQAAPARTPGGLVVGRLPGTRRPGLDLGTVVVPTVAAAADETLVVPPDVIWAPPADVGAHPVLGRPPVVVDDLGPGRTEVPVDEAVINPVGYQRVWTEPVATLRADATIERGDDRLDLSRGVTERHVRDLRAAQGVRVVWPRLRGRGRVETLARAVVGLAAAGVPLPGGDLPPDAEALLGSALAAALATRVDLDDPLTRDERSLVARRAALDTHSVLAWRTRLAERAGVAHRGLPTVSVVLATRRAEMVGFALRQVARQRGADVELVLATHGFTPDPGLVRGTGLPVTVLSHPAETLFGDVLRAAVAASSGEVVLKMDDDDWYSPDVVHDLLLARHYSGARLVGMPAEWVWLAEADVTVRRTDPEEVYGRFVAGGTLMVDRGLLAEVGGFRPVRRWVDAQLLVAVRAAGATTYRTHGLGYLLRREATGHTWSQDVAHFRDPRTLEREWPGFAPSRLMEVDEIDRP